MHRAHKIKLEPTPEQEVYFAQACGVARFAYNWALSEWKKEYEAGGRPSEMSLRKKLNSIKADQFPWMDGVTKCAPQQAVKNLGAAFKKFFTRASQGKKPGYPKFKRKGVHDSFRSDNGPRVSGADAVSVKGRFVSLPVCGTVKMRECLRFKGQVVSATVSKLADGWYVSLLVNTPDRLTGSGPVVGGVVGVDLGVRQLATLSNGEVFPSLRPGRDAQIRAARLSRNVSRKKLGSANRAKARAKLARLHQKIGNSRADALHKLTRKLATEFDTIAIEDLNVAGMLKNHRLARSVADAGFAEFRRQLEYKALMTGAEVIVVDRYFPSSKTCSTCGTIHEMNLNNRRMVCGCGNSMDRDLNAAINLKNMAASYAVTACGDVSSGARRKPNVKLTSMKQEEKSSNNFS